MALSSKAEHAVRTIVHAILNWLEYLEVLLGHFATLFGASSKVGGSEARLGGGTPLGAELDLFHL